MSIIKTADDTKWYVLETFYCITKASCPDCQNEMKMDGGNNYCVFFVCECGHHLINNYSDII